MNRYKKILTKIIKWTCLVIYLIMHFYFIYAVVYFLVDLYQLDQMDIREMEAHEQRLKEKNEEIEKFIGYYEFNEAITQTDNIKYEINIYNESDDKNIRYYNVNHYATIKIQGDDVNMYIKASMNFKNGKLQFFYIENLQNGTALEFENSQLLLEFENKGDELLTYWGAIKPQLEENKLDGKVYFKKVAD